MNKEHIVRVGPVHAGIIEPGIFEFTCVGEKVLNLDIKLGCQHRGIENLILKAAAERNTLKMMCLAEQIAGDTTVGHATAMVKILEHGKKCNPIVEKEREVALELERMAMNIGDISALSGDVAHQTGHVACEALRTLCINAMQRLSGSRFGRTLIRPNGSHYRITVERCDDLMSTVEEVNHRFQTVRKSLMTSPSVLSRFEDMCLMAKPNGRYGGDLRCRVEMRFNECDASAKKIVEICGWLKSNWFETHSEVDYNVEMEANKEYSSTVRGWRGEIRHTCKTDESGKIVEYKIVDPSADLWKELAASIRNGDISDFPINNKSFNLSYCGTDL